MAIPRLLKTAAGGLAARPVTRILPVLGLLAAIGGVVWYSYPAKDAGQEAPVPLIRADASAYKIMPADPGGMDIPHRDSTIFDTIRSARIDGGRPIENLLAGPEEPLSRGEIFAGLKAEAEAEMAIQKAEAASGEATEKAGVAAESSEPELPQPAVKPNPPPKAVEAAKAAEKAVAESVAATEPAAGRALDGKFFIQLGSLRSREDAEKSWQTFQARFPAELEDLKLRVQEADLGERGKYYRVQAGPVEEAEAKSICRAVEEKQPGGCLVVRR